jgi:hypothetical protein
MEPFPICELVFQLCPEFYARDTGREIGTSVFVPGKGYPGSTQVQTFEKRQM